MKKALALGVVALSAVSCSGSCSKKVTVDKTKKTISLKQDTKSMQGYEQTASGLGFKVLQAAAEGAASPKAGQKVTVHYTGWLEAKDGEPDLSKKFDSSVDRGQKFSFTIGVGQVIRGWDEGVMAMKVGEKRRLLIPAELGYGLRGAGNVIPGGATLIFDVELFDVK